MEGDTGMSGIQSEARHPTFRKMTLLIVMYMMQNIHIGFSWTLLPLLMREQGAGLSEIGFSVLVYSPWALKFLYTSMADRWYIPRLGRQKTGFAPLMILTCLTLPVLGLFDPCTRLKTIYPLLHRFQNGQCPYLCP